MHNKIRKNTGQDGSRTRKPIPGTLGDTLSHGTEMLRTYAISHPRWNASVLLGHTLNLEISVLLTRLEDRITPRQQTQFTRLIQSRTRHIPLPYVIGEWSFWGLTFRVNRHVLIPRPETEMLVEHALVACREGLKSCSTTLVDVGTGSGCIALALAHELRNSNSRTVRVYATDRSAAALRVARANAKHLGLAHHVQFFEGDLLEPLFKKAKTVQQSRSLIIVANLPYLNERQYRDVPPEVKAEPKHAIVAGSRGMVYYARLVRQLAQLMGMASKTEKNRQHVVAFFEIDPRQKKTIADLVRQSFPRARISFYKDLSRRTRVVAIDIDS